MAKCIPSFFIILTLIRASGMKRSVLSLLCALCVLGIAYGDLCVTWSQLNVRSTPCGGIIGAVYQNDQLADLGNRSPSGCGVATNGPWAQIRTPSGTVGWVATDGVSSCGGGGGGGSSGGGGGGGGLTCTNAESFLGQSWLDNPPGSGSYAGECVSFIRWCTGDYRAGSVNNWKRGTSDRNQWARGDVVATWYNYYASGYGGHVTVYWGPVNSDCFEAIDQNWGTKTVTKHNICTSWGCSTCNINNYAIVSV